MEQLHALAQACRVASAWTDVEGRAQQVADDALAAVLAALGHETASERQIARSLAAVQERRAALPVAATRAEIAGEDGIARPLPITGNRLRVLAASGYCDLALDRRTLCLAVALRHFCGAG